MSEDKKTDSKGRKRKPTQTAALIESAKERAYKGDVTATQVHLAAEKDAIEWFKGLSPRDRGRIVDNAFSDSKDEQSE